ncbi:MAG: hypothetical protein KDK34_04370, partial [Leptospiraceae bacterium]|nr:hypothetical protein [Leptospiraceae bacterium]
MPVLQIMQMLHELNDIHAEMRAWRHRIHRHPELAFQEEHTAELVATVLKEAGLHVETGIAGTGVVATLENGPGPAIGLRADMDALPLQELNTFEHR